MEGLESLLDYLQQSVKEEVPDASYNQHGEGSSQANGDSYGSYPTEEESSPHTIQTLGSLPPKNVPQNDVVPYMTEPPISYGAPNMAYHPPPPHHPPPHHPPPPPMAYNSPYPSHVDNRFHHPPYDPMAHHHQPPMGPPMNDGGMVGGPQCGNVPMPHQQGYYPMNEHSNNYGPPMMPQKIPKKRGRKKKIKPEDQQPEYIMTPDGMRQLKQDPVDNTFKQKKKYDRFHGTPEEEVKKKVLPDHLIPNLDIVIVGINPGLFAAYKGHHYAGPGNHFWKCLYLSGLTPEPMTSDDDYKLINYGIGFTNMVARTTKGSADLSRKEIKEGGKLLLEKLQKYQPKIAVFNGKGIYEIFSGKKNFCFGKQPEKIEGTSSIAWVMPSSSARCAQLPRAADKVPFYIGLRKLKDYMNGVIKELDDSEVVFTGAKLKNVPKKVDGNGQIKEEEIAIKEESETTFKDESEANITEEAETTVKEEPEDDMTIKEEPVDMDE